MPNLHVVSTTTIPTIIKYDCKSAVHILEEIRQGDMPEGDLWQKVAELMPSDNNFIQCQCMPSHLNDKGYERRRTVNDQADDLAKQALQFDPLPKHIAANMRDTHAITTIVQAMMADIWNAHVASTEKTGPGDEINRLQEIDEQLKVASEQMENHDDYMPFGCCVDGRVWTYRDTERRQCYDW